MCTFAHHMTIAVPVAVAAAVGPHLLTRYVWSQSDSKEKVNLDIDKDSAKVVHSFDVEDISRKAVYCRCWRSRKVGVQGGKYYCVKKVSGLETVVRCSLIVHSFSTNR